MRSFFASLLLFSAAAAADLDPVDTLGRSSLILKKELSIPANRDCVDLPEFAQIQSSKRNFIGYGIYLEDSFVCKFICRIHMREKIDSPRSIPAGTMIELSGEYQGVPMPHPITVAHCIAVTHPPQLEYVAFGSYVEQRRSLMGERERLVALLQRASALSVGDFRRAVAGFASIEDPEVVIIK